VRVQVPPRVLTDIIIMKKLVAAVFVTVSLASCHYGQEEAKKTLERNDKYKSDNADYSVHSAGEYSYENKEEKAVSVDTPAAH
jgi:hypothetical protein